MSFLPISSIRASSSRLAHASTYLARPKPSTARLYASKADAPEPKAKSYTAQAADEQLEEIARRTAQLKRMGRNIDFTSVDMPPLEYIVEPPFSAQFLLGKGRWTYWQDRGRRYINTRRCMAETRRRGGFEPPSPEGRMARFVQFFANIRQASLGRDLIEELFSIYTKYNAAQAIGDEGILRQLSSGQALSDALRLAPTARSKRMSWELVRRDAVHLKSARISPVDTDSQIFMSQVVLRIETEQALSTGTNGQKSRRQQKVVENWMFERVLPPRVGWKIKQKLETTPPPFE